MYPTGGSLRSREKRVVEINVEAQERKRIQEKEVVEEVQRVYQTDLWKRRGKARKEERREKNERKTKEDGVWGEW